MKDQVKPNFKATFTEMQHGIILGIVDHQDAVESYFIPVDKIDSWYHGDIFDFKGVFYRWRWDERDGITTADTQFAYCNDMDPEFIDKVRSHIERKYGIKFLDNGRVDHEHFSLMTRIETLDCQNCCFVDDYKTCTQVDSCLKEWEEYKKENGYL